MSVQGYGSLGSFMYSIHEGTTYGAGGSGGTLAAPQLPTTSDIHIPFNPMTKFSWKMVEMQDVEEVYIGDDQPTVYSVGWGEGEVKIESLYHAPFQLTRMFATTTSGAWAADATATITCTMVSNLTTQKSECIHIHIEDKASSEDLDLNFFGAYMEEYAWVWEKEKPVRERINYKFCQSTTGAIAFNSAATYHNQKFAAWNDERFDASTSNVIGVGKGKITLTTTTAISADIGPIESIEWIIKVKRYPVENVGSDAMYHVQNGDISVEVIVKCKPTGNTPILQMRSKWQDRTAGTVQFKITDNSGSDYYEYLQCTNMRIKSIGDCDLPSAADEGAMGLQLTFKNDINSALTFAGKYKYASVPTPDGYI